MVPLNGYLGHVGHHGAAKTKVIYARTYMSGSRKTVLFHAPSRFMPQENSTVHRKVWIFMPQNGRFIPQIQAARLAVEAFL